jgi:hypothetical protein
MLRKLRKLGPEGNHPQNTDYDNQNQLENVEYFNSLGSIIINEARGTREIQSRIVMAKAAFNKKALFTSKLDLYLKNKRVKCYIWSIALCGAETWTLQTVDQNYLECLKCGWCWRWMERSIGLIM